MVRAYWRKQIATNKNQKQKIKRETQRVDDGNKVMRDLKKIEKMETQ